MNHQLKQNQVVELLKILIQQPSISPAQAQHYHQIQSILIDYGFDCTLIEKKHMNSDGQEYMVCSMVVVYEPDELSDSHVQSDTMPTLGFLCHMDVVPAQDQWNHDPFTLVQEGQRLYGRGTSDMKGQMAAVFVAFINYVQSWNHQSHQSHRMVSHRMVSQRMVSHRMVSSPLMPLRLVCMITGDEETDGFGVQDCMEHLKAKNLMPSHIICTEPTGCHTAFDQIKIGRRGSYHAHVNFKRTGGHVAYKTNNILHDAIAWMQEIPKVLDDGDDSLPQSTLHITGVDVEQTVENVIPSFAHVRLNVRYNRLWNRSSLDDLLYSMHKETTTNNDAFDLSVNDHSIHDHLVYEEDSLSITYKSYSSIEPFLCTDDSYITYIQRCIQSVTGKIPQLVTTGGASDSSRIGSVHGCIIVDAGMQAIKIHERNEYTTIENLKTAVQVYQTCIQHFVQDFLKKAK